MNRKILIDLDDNGALKIISKGFRGRDEKSGVKFGDGLDRLPYLIAFIVVNAIGYYFVNFIIANFIKDNQYILNADMNFAGVYFLSGAFLVSAVTILITFRLISGRLSDMGYNKAEAGVVLWSVFFYGLAWYTHHVFNAPLIFVAILILIRWTIMAVGGFGVVETFFTGLWLMFGGKNEKYRRAILDGKYSDEEIKDVYLENLPPTQAPVYRSSNSSIEEIRELNELFEEGIITREEFEKKKKKILDI